ncbi:LysR family transcriptional regulator [Paraburkholderia sp.]|uniref:LysR family transcriptional regulator n=1 Tax=Paraburkholderia sp. TaxID=1926495 RepID=UPI00239E82D9|nr:LysR family transcriptional regulator [Paraburkholderia sp.]MDE1180966.1 LysR family transcriptional regulator [Paraburkholderia sp.]
MESLADIRLFVEAANLGGLSAAGRKLNLSPAAASARLTRLEANLGIRLFERTTRKLRLTEEGQTYLEHCEIAVQALEDAHAALQAGRSVVRGRVRISATSDFGRHVLKGWLDEFNVMYPEVVLSVVLTDSVLNLLHDEIDLAIRFGTAEDSSFVARPLAPNRRVMCASPEYFASHGKPAHPRDLAGFDFIVLGTGASAAGEWRFSRNGATELFSVPRARARETNDGALAREWALAGYGLAMKSIWDISADLSAGRLVIALPEWTTPQVPVYAFYQRSRFMAPRVRVLLDFLAERFASAETEIAPLLGM